MNRAVLLDRDGVINRDVGYAHRPDQIVFEPGVFEFCRAAKARDYRIVIVTNQSGIGRGLYSEADFQVLMRWMADLFREEAAPLAGWYHCPHHPTAGLGIYRRTCGCRKPAPGLLLRAAEEHSLDLARCWMIGDKPTDLAAAAAAGVPGRLYGAEAGGASFDDLIELL